MRVFSFGGGVQSTAVLVLVGQGRLQYDAMLFVNVGDDSENPETLRYVQEIARPFAEANGIRFEELSKPESLLAWTLRSERSITLPMYLPGGGPGNRECTRYYKIRVVARWLKDHGATREQPATVGLGISTDEYQRARTESGLPYEVLEYPLLALRLSRADCLRIVASAGLPQPPKSACWFCPFHRIADWRRMKHDAPELFRRAVDLERTLRDRRLRLGRDRVYLTNYGRPLDQVISGEQLTLDDALDTCESGYCMT